MLILPPQYIHWGILLLFGQVRKCQILQDAICKRGDQMLLFQTCQKGPNTVLSQVRYPVVSGGLTQTIRKYTGKPKKVIPCLPTHCRNGVGLVCGGSSLKNKYYIYFQEMSKQQGKVKEYRWMSITVYKSYLKDTILANFQILFFKNEFPAKVGT